MDYETFQVAVVEIASDGVPLTVANVVARMRMDPVKAEKLLDRMARDGRLDLDVDESEGVVVYRVRGLTPRSKARAPGGPRKVVDVILEETGIGDAARSAAMKAILGSDHDDAGDAGTAVAFGRPFADRGVPLPKALRRSVTTGVAVGGLLPGAGLAYAAPWPVVLGATIAVVVGFKLLAALTLFFAVPFLFAAAIGSAVLGGVYTWRYNQTGRRTPLGGPAPKRLVTRSARLRS